MPNLAKKTRDALVDQTDKVLTPTMRAGQTIKRITNLLAHKVKSEVIVAQLNATSTNKNTYTMNEIRGYEKLFQDSITRVGISKETETALIEDQALMDEAITNKSY
ncbi:hypothetical protein [Acinetobacter sp. AGC35]